MQAARVLEVEPVENSEKLWLCKVDCGDENPKQIVAGLQAYVPRDVMQGLEVVTVCNLKPAKLAGQMSEAMILAASCMDGDTRIVKTLKPAEGCTPGERVCISQIHTCSSPGVRLRHPGKSCRNHASVFFGASSI